MENIRCKTCGGTVVREKNHYVCEFCLNRWEIDRADDVYAVDRANAWAALRNGDFEKAMESFEALLTKDPDNYEAHWGCALSMNGIIYVDDIHENKRVPTCNNITETSFLKSHHLTKAISLAPEDIAGSYRQQSERIEKIRLEWLEKASKEPPYDVFICFKDSDRENGIDRTQDSIDAQDLYNALVAEKFRVFYSRVSLRDKISEQYEPYIYNAIKTAKVMIVFGEKPEYFSATWLKNEWSRFRLRMEKGEKHPNSLVVVYKNMNPGDLPAALKSRQCLNASDMTFFSDLSKHIKRVIAEQGKAAQLERVELKGGRVSKKADRIASETIQVREIGSHAVTEIDISEKQQLSLVYSFINARQWKDASKQIDDILFNNPNNAEALWCRLLVKHNLQKNEALAQALPGMRKEDFALIEKVLNCADANLAATVLDTLYALRDKVGEAPYLELLQTILPFNYEGRSAAIEACFARAIEAGNYRVFRLLLTTLDSEDVDRYIEYHIAYAKQAVKLKNTKQFEECIAAVLAVDNGNPHALLLRWTARIETAPLPELIALTEELLQYSSDPDHVVDALLQSFSQKLKNKTQCALAKQIIKYYQGNLKKIEQTLVALAHKMIEESFFEDAESVLSLVQSVDKNLPEVYWYLCLAKARATKDSEIVKSWKLVKKLPEYTKYLALVDEEKRQRGMQYAVEQAKRKLKVITSLIAATVVVMITALTVTSLNYVIKNPVYEDAVVLMQEEKYVEAIDLFDKLGHFRNSKKLREQCGLNVYDTETWEQIKDIQVGDTYVFGHYEQDNNFTNGAESIEWIVLEKTGEKMFLVSKYGLDIKKYHVTYSLGSIDWVNSDIRSWLNGEFCENSFTSEERTRLLFKDTSEWMINTSDQVFLLSSVEARQYLKSKKVRRCKPTAYALSKYESIEENLGENGCSTWWLRDNGEWGRIMNVYPSGHISDYSYGITRDSSDIAVRPAIWIDLSKLPE